MFNAYSDITERIPEPPMWWDEEGVPRYAPFEPYRAANIYAKEVVLMEIACSQCPARFRVAFSAVGVVNAPDRRALAETIQTGEIDYGDPPGYGHCQAGAAAGCHNLRILQYWSRQTPGPWIRDSRLEIDLPGLSDVRG